jgi:phospholipase/carboxylesterase
MKREDASSDAGALRAWHRAMADVADVRDTATLLRAGTHPLEVDDERIGLMHVTRERPAPGEGWTVIALFHGAGADAADIIPLLADVPMPDPTIVLAPDSVASSWDLVHGRLGPDLRRLDAVLELLLEQIPVAHERMAVSGFSDGASYALSVGLSNGELFPNIIAFSPGFASPPRIVGMPRVFISHGTGDRVLPIDRCSRVIVPRLRGAGYSVDFHEFDGGHTVPEPMVEAALEWLSAAPVSAR